jgi:phospholipid/cholesterol/gamma-HCH transport system ATP-binding protein
VAQALDFVELGGTLEKFPSELSGGMRRRAAIARAVVTAPPLMLYDSPTAGLDPITAHTIMALLIKERDISQDHHPDGDAPLSGRQPDGEFPLQFGTRSFGARPPRRRADASTTFMVLQEGRLIFEGGQDLLEASTDPYISQVREAAGLTMADRRKFAGRS